VNAAECVVSEQENDPAAIVHASDVELPLTKTVNVNESPAGTTMFP
jgi:hypothetical protein